MKHIRLSIVLLALTSLSVANAQEGSVRQPERQQSNDSQEINTNKFCVYAGSLYSLGAVIAAGDEMLECQMLPSTSELIEPGARWTRLELEDNGR